MRLATTQQNLEQITLAAALQRWLRPAVGFDHPREVLKDPLLNPDDKRAILASWASDASAVQDQPQLRWLIGTPGPVPLRDIREALERLDRWDGDDTPAPA